MSLLLVPLAKRKKYNLPPIVPLGLLLFQYRKLKFSLVFNSENLPPRLVKLTLGGKFTPG